MYLNTKMFEDAGIEIPANPTGRWTVRRDRQAAHQERAREDAQWGYYWKNYTDQTFAMLIAAFGGESCTVRTAKATVTTGENTPKAVPVHV